MKKALLLVFIIALIITATSCGQDTNMGFKSKLPTFTEARITTGGSEWTIPIASYEICGDKIYIHGSNGIDVLVPSDTCILVSINH